MTNTSPLTKGLFICAIVYDMVQPFSSTSPCVRKQEFMFMRKYKRKHGRIPRGYFRDAGWYTDRVEVRWLWTSNLGYFAPLLTFDGCSANASNLARKISHSLQCSSEKISYYGVLDRLGAIVVNPVETDHSLPMICRPIRYPNENPMETLSRALD